MEYQDGKFEIKLTDMSKVPVKRGSVKARSSFFEGLQQQGSPGSTNESPGVASGNENQQDKVAKPKWMVRHVTSICQTLEKVKHTTILSW